jgi:hypothetical protein
MGRPNFFLVGHPRSGSGQLFSWLDRHPEVFSTKKELHYFGSDLRFFEPPRSLENYLSYFKGAERFRRAGDASTWTLFSERAAREIQAFEPDARIMMLLRNPVQQLHSLHAHFLFRGDENIADFRAALDAEEARAAGTKPEPDWRVPRDCLRYSRMARFGPQVQRFFDRFGRDRVLVLLSEDFRADPKGTFDKVCAHLDIATRFDGYERLFETSPRKANSNRAARSGAIRSFLADPRHYRVLEGVDASVPGHQLTLRALRRWNKVFVPREPMDPGLRRELQDRFRPWIDETSDLIGRDLSHWHTPSQGKE